MRSQIKVHGFFFPVFFVKSELLLAWWLELGYPCSRVELSAFREGCLLCRDSQFEILTCWSFQILFCGNPRISPNSHGISTEFRINLVYTHGPPQKWRIFRENRLFKVDISLNVLKKLTTSFYDVFTRILITKRVNRDFKTIGGGGRNPRSIICGFRIW